MGHVRIWGSPGLATTQGHPARPSIFNHKYLCKRLLSAEASLPRGSNERGKDAPRCLAYNFLCCTDRLASGGEGGSGNSGISTPNGVGWERTNVTFA